MLICVASQLNLSNKACMLIALAVPEILNLLQGGSSGSCSTPQTMRQRPVMQWRWPPFSTRQRS